MSGLRSFGWWWLISRACALPIMVVEVTMTIRANAIHLRRQRWRVLDLLLVTFGGPLHSIETISLFQDLALPVCRLACVKLPWLTV